MTLFSFSAVTSIQQGAEELYEKHTLLLSCAFMWRSKQHPFPHKNDQLNLDVGLSASFFFFFHIAVNAQAEEILFCECTKRQLSFKPVL